MHQHQAVDLGEALGPAVVGHGDEQGEQEDGTGVHGSAELGREDGVCEVATQPGEIHTESHSEAIVVGCELALTLKSGIVGMVLLASHETRPVNVHRVGSLLKCLGMARKVSSYLSRYAKSW